MDAADQISNVPTTSQGNNAAARAAALKARIRELRDRAHGHSAPIEVAENVSDTPPTATTEIAGDAFAELAHTIDRSRAGRVPALPYIELAGIEPAGIEPDRGSRQTATTTQPRWRRSPPPQVTLSAESRESGELRTIKDWLSCTPSWAISAGVHALLLVALALLTVSQDSFAPAIVVTGAQVEPEIVASLTDDIKIGAPKSDSEEPLWNLDVMDAGPMQIKALDLLAATDFSADLTRLSVRSEQLDAAQNIAGSADWRRGNRGGGAQFYGIQAIGDRFVFIVDSSTSMQMKFAEAKRELEKAIRKLHPEQLFYVIFFDRNAERLRLGKWNKRRTRYSLHSRPEPNLVPASNENMNALIYWMNTIQLDSDTNPYTAVVYALRVLKPDAIFLLSDGEFNDNGSTEAFLERENLTDDPTKTPLPKTIVHCVGFHSRRGEVTLKRIAKTHGGTYRFIEPPGAAGKITGRRVGRRARRP